MKQTFAITGMTCATCQVTVQKAVSQLKGVASVQVNLLTNAMVVEYEQGLEKTIIQEVQEAGYNASILTSSNVEQRGRQRQHNTIMRRRLIISFAFLIPLMIVSMGPMLGLPFPMWFTEAYVNLPLQWVLTLPVVYVNFRYFSVGLKRLWKRDPNMDSLVAIGTGAALVYGLYITMTSLYGVVIGDDMLAMSYMNQLYLESAATILALVTLGKYLEERSKQKTLGALEKLMDLAPKKALKLIGEEVEEVLVTSLKVNDIIRVLPGTIIPLDGTIVQGETSINQAAITGESIPVDKRVGDSVIGATMNQLGAIDIQVSHVGEETTLAKIIKLVEEASQSKAPLAKLADTVAGIFVPIVIGIALLTFLIWLAVGQPFTFALQILISILVISCPCALGLATPVAIMVGAGKGAELGVLMKSAEAVEKLATVNTIVLDKTGTITLGQPQLMTLLPEPNVEATTLLHLAGSLEALSEHPIAKAVVLAMKEKAHVPYPVDQFVVVPGVGVRGVIKGVTYRLGKVKEVTDSRLSEHLKQGRSVIQLSTKTESLGYLVLADALKPTSKEAISRMHELGLRVVMLTGDLEPVARVIAQDVGIDDVIAQVMPEGKDAHIQALQTQGRRVAMVGDGINDAPSLMRADVGLAIGAGTDIAIESADMVLLQSDLMQVVHAIQLAKKVVTNMKMNLFWAFIYNVIAIPLAAGVLFPFTGWLLSPMIAAGAMALSSVSVVLNALRLRRFKPESR